MNNIARICTIVSFVFAATAVAGSEQIKIEDKNVPFGFAIVSDAGATADIVFDNSEAEVVSIASNLLAKDIQRVSEKLPDVKNDIPTQAANIIVIGTIGKSKYIDELIASNKIDVSQIEGKWESYTITQIDSTFENIEHALVIAGSDRRGTAYGVFSISEAIGVSPWYWWADVPAKKQSSIYYANETIVQGEPSVKYRGIFINDEDFGMRPWAEKHMDTDIKDIGPRTYEKVFELLLRLKANYCWPGMHHCTKAFNIYPENKVVADRYAIVMGASHCEPMLRNNVTEWDKKTMGAWDYKTNSERIYEYWNSRVAENGKYENVYTVGMRGIHDSGIPGGGTGEEKRDRLEKIIADQRKILAEHVNPDPSKVPQIFCPYKEVLDIYKLGMKLPDDITIVWPDDNHGYVRNLSDEAERKRAGHSGIYYHLSYWGSPADYLWISSTSPAKISYEMCKSYAYGADRLWVFNAGDIKPCEMELTFAMELAYDVEKWQPKNAMNFIEQWASKTFGEEYAGEIANIYKEYYRLAQQARPEHIDRVQFTEKQMRQRLADYKTIAEKAESLYSRIDDEYKDAYFQLVLYPVKGAADMNAKHTYAAMGNAEEAIKAYDEIQEMTRHYNKEIEGGKWDGMMDASPKNMAVFAKPDAEKIAERTKTPNEPVAEPKCVLDAAKYNKLQDTSANRWEKIEGLGISSYAMTVMPFKTEPIDENNIEQAPSISYEFFSNEKTCSVEVRFLPTFRINDGMGLRYAISVDGGTPQVADVNTKSKSGQWSQNVLRGYSASRTEHKLEDKDSHTVTIHLLDPGMVISQLRVY